MLENKTGSVAQEASEGDAKATDSTSKNREKYYAIVLFILCCIPLFVTSYVYYKQSRPQGDEPHYLIISQTMQLYYSIDVMRDYTRGDYRSFYPSGIDPHVSPNAQGKPLPMHSIGGPFLWLIPFILLGRLGAIFFISLLSALIVVCIYQFLVEMRIRKGYAFFVSLAFAIGSPIYIYSHLTFIEPIAALACIYVLYVLVKRQMRTLDLVISSIALGVLPWIHIRFALIEIVLFLFVLYRLYKEDKFTHYRRYAGFLIPVIALFLLFEAYNLMFWGTLNPAANQANSGQVPFQRSPFFGMAGIFLDQEFGLLTNFPIFIFMLGGIVLTLKKKYLSLHVLLLLLFVPYILMFTSFGTWSGGWTPPGRFLMVLTPTLAFYIAYALQQARSKILNGLCALFVLFSFAIGVAYIGAKAQGFNGGRGRSLAMLHLQEIIRIPFTSYIPSMYMPQQKRLFAVWIAGSLALTLVIYLLARRRQEASVNDEKK